MKKDHKWLRLNYVFTLTFTVLPFLAFITRGRLIEFNALDWHVISSSLWVSMKCSLIAMLIVILLGLPTGYYIARHSFKYKIFFDTLFNLPMVLHPAVIGLLLLLTYGSHGFIGRYLLAMGIKTSFSSFAVILTFIFVSLPVFIKGVSVAFSEVDEQLETTARILGDSPLQVFKRITFPLAKKGLIVSLLMSWTRGLSEFGATIMFAGNLKGVTQTLPLAIYSAMESNMNNALFISFFMFILALLVLVSTHLLSEERDT